jgi:hypothetical protein
MSTYDSSDDEAMTERNSYPRARRQTYGDYDDYGNDSDGSYSRQSRKHKHKHTKKTNYHIGLIIFGIIIIIGLFVAYKVFTGISKWCTDGGGGVLSKLCWFFENLLL